MKIWKITYQYDGEGHATIYAETKKEAMEKYYEGNGDFENRDWNGNQEFIDIEQIENEKV